MSDVLIAVVSHASMVDTVGHQAGDSPAISIAAFAARHLLDELYPTRVPALNTVYVSTQLPLDVDSVQYLILTKRLMVEGGEYALTLIAMSDAVIPNTVVPPVVKGLPDAIVFYGKEFNVGYDGDITLPSKRLIRDVGNCDRHAVVKSGALLTPYQLMTLLCAGSCYHSRTTMSDRTLHWTVGDKDSEPYLIVECGVKDYYLRQFQETGKFLL